MVVCGTVRWGLVRFGEAVVFCYGLQRSVGVGSGKAVEARCGSVSY